MIKIATHDGGFHSDDVFAVAALQLLLKDKEVQIFRTRDQTILDTAEYVVDVGEVYDHERRRYDHHQNGAPVRENSLPYSAFGLVWKHYGVAIAGGEEAANMIEERFVQPIDAGDNGINLYTLNEIGVPPCELYLATSSFKPAWGSEKTDDEAFLEAVQFAKDLLTRVIQQKQSEQAQQELVARVYAAAEDKTTLVFEVAVNQQIFMQYEDVMTIVYPSSAEGGEDRWKVGTIPTPENFFTHKVQFPESWGGLRDEELEKVSGIPGAKFCHKGLWRFVADSKEGAIAAAKMEG